MNKIITQIQKSKNIFEYYFSSIKEKYDNCKNLWNVEEFEYTFYDYIHNLENHKNFYELLDKTCKSNIFKLTEEFFFRMVLLNKINFNTFPNILGGKISTSIITDFNDIIKEIDCLDLPSYTKKSNDFIYLHESVHGVFYESRIGKKYIENEDLEVLPNFMMLYALDKLDAFYPLQSKTYTKSLFISDTLILIDSILKKLNDKRYTISDDEIKIRCKNNDDLELLVELNNTKKNRESLYSDYIQVIGKIKAIALFNCALEKSISFDTIFNSITNSFLPMGKELEYNNFKIDNIYVIDSYLEFLNNNYKSFESLTLTKE